ncbi:MAG: serpin family protein [Candidatus Limnocylindrales bacterium]
MSGEFASIEGASVLTHGARVVDLGITHEQLIELTAANSDFALDLYRSLAAQSDDNILLGPHSISTALAMVYDGARGQTATDMGRVLHLDALGANVPERFNALDFALVSREQPGVVELRTANQAFAQPGLPLVESYLETLSRQFGAPLAELEFGDADRARGVINDWAAEQTNNRITELFPPGTISADTRLVVVNAISLDASWRYLFDPADTTGNNFTLADDETTVNVPTMHFDLRLPLAFEPDYEAVELMYGRGDLSMVLILPRSLPSFEEHVDSEMLKGIFDSISDRGIHLALPKFSFQRHVAMDEIFQGLGMGSAYGAGADFTGMVEGGGLSLATVQHDAFIEVDEAGTEAHAATGGAMAVSHGPGIEFNRPFFFVIRDRITNAIIFVGRVSDPRG